MKAIHTKGLSKRYWFYKKEAGLKGSLKSLFRGEKIFVEAVRGIDLEIEVGERIGFIGPNGAGKTTSLKMFSGILYPTSGEIEVLGFLPYKREKRFLSQITFISGQRSQLFWDLPAKEYFNFCREVYHIPERDFKKQLKRLVELAEIEEILTVPQRKLSFGQRKRCELVAGMLHDPKLIFLDEPTNALDLINARKVREFIKEKAGEGRSTILLTSHNMADIESVCERVVILNRGKIVYNGKIGDLYRFNGFKRKVKVVFSSAWEREGVGKLGKVLSLDGQEVVMEVASEEIKRVTTELMTQFPIQDIRIEDPPLETIIESIYKREVEESHLS